MNNRKSASSAGSDDLEKLSDSELRHRLLQYGFPNMPVTETTRKILIKKLRNQLNNEKIKLKRQTKFVTRYSSDEESDNQPEPKATIRGRSSIMASFRTPPPAAKAQKMPPPSSSTVLGRRSNVTGSSNNSFTTTTNTNYMQSSPQPPQQQSKASPKGSPNIYVPPPILASDSEEDSDYLNYSSKKHYNTPSYTPPTTPAAASTSIYRNNASTSLNNITLDRSMNNSWAAQGSYYSSSPTNSCSGLQANGQSNNSSATQGIDFTRRLLNLRGETIRDSILQKRNVPLSSAAVTPHNNMPLRQINHTNTSLDPSDIVYRQSVDASGSGIGRYSTTNDNNKKNISPSTALARLIARLDEQYGLKQTFIPCVLVTSLLLFFVLVAFVYITISPDLINTINRKSTTYEICTPQDHSSALAKVTYSCIEQDHLEGAIDLLKVLVPELQRRAEVHFCSDNDQSQAISAREFVKHVHKLGLATDVRKTLKDLHSSEYLIEKNPQWKIDHVNYAVEKISFDDVVKLRNTQGNFFAILRPRLPFTCTLYNKLHEFFIVIGTATLIVGAILFMHIVYKFVQDRRKMKIATVEHLTNDIINELMRQAISDTTTGNGTTTNVVVNHLRDKIIPLYKRKEKSWAWNEAIRNLEHNDSRIQFDMSIKNGEECKTMKWIANVSMDFFGRSSVKQWQSPAFDKTNKIIQPPTSCLKIRQMFEPVEANNPHLKQIIQDAILEKVGPQCKIYDIQLDKQSCCVYVHCASEQDAGIVHNEINGWWFDKRLVSIKFLRLQRYKSRFPNSSTGPKCLQPSNSNNLSMTQCTRDFGAANGLNVDGDDDDDDDEDDDELDEDVH